MCVCVGGAGEGCGSVGGAAERCVCVLGGLEKDVCVGVWEGRCLYVRARVCINSSTKILILIPILTFKLILM